MKGGKPAKRYSQAGRLHDVIRLIEARHGITIDELVEETGVDRRTVHRDLAAIQEAGYPLVSEWQGARKVYSFITGFKGVPPIRFTLQELMTLSLLRSQIDFLKGTPFHDDMDAIARKIGSVLPPSYAAHMERVAKVVLPLLSGGRDYSRVSGQLAQLREALLYQYRVSLSYAARGRTEAGHYKVEPYTFIVYKEGLYLLGYARNRRGLRTFAVDRILSVTVHKEERFDIPEEFNADEQLRRAFGIVDEPAMPVKVRFSAEMAASVRDRTWHHSQKICEEPGGGIVLSFEAGGRMEIIAWLLSFGAHAEVLEPVELREELRHQVRQMMSRYGES